MVHVAARRLGHVGRAPELVQAHAALALHLLLAQRRQLRAVRFVQHAQFLTQVLVLDHRVVHAHVKQLGALSLVRDELGNVAVAERHVGAPGVVRVLHRAAAACPVAR